MTEYKTPVRAMEILNSALDDLKRHVEYQTKQRDRLLFELAEVNNKINTANATLNDVITAIARLYLTNQ